MNRRLHWLFAGLLAMGFLGVAVISWRNYQGVESLFEADPPTPMLASPQLTGVANLTAAEFMSRDGLKLAAWYAPPRNGAAVIITHGTNGDRSMMLPEIRLLANAGFGVLAFDWPGLGQSGGEVRWNAQACNALVAAIDWLAARPEVDSRRIGGLGFSMGGFIMTMVAAGDPRLHAVVLEAAPTSFRDYLQEHDTRWGFLSEWSGWLVMRRSGLLDPGFESVKVIDRIAPRPVLLLSGTKDTEVPSRLVKKLFDAARDPKALWIVEGAEHGGYFSVAASQYTTKLTTFFDTNLAGN